MQSLASLAAAPENASAVGAIRQASAESGVDFSYMLRQAATESSLDPTARAGTSSAAGLYQFIDQTWLTEMSEHGAQFGLGRQAAAISIDSSGHASVADAAMRSQIMALKNDATVAAEMAAAFTKENQAYLQSTVGGTIGATELYLAHFLGAGGAARFLSAMKQSPGQSAASILPAAADANEPVFYHADGSPRSLGEVYNRFAAKFSGTMLAGTASYSATGAYAAYAGSALPSIAAGQTPPGSLDPAQPWGEGRTSLYEMMLMQQLDFTPPEDKKDRAA